MSDIDLFHHYRVGVFRTIPIYMAREDGCWLHQTREDGEVDPSNTMRKGNLSIGGGGGEHGALVIHDPTYCAAFFLKEYDFPDSQNINEYLMRHQDKLVTYCNGYSESSWIKEFDLYYAHLADIYKFDQWIAVELGQFIYHCLSDFYPKVANWKESFGDLDVQFTMIQIPWDHYSGNGANLFNLKRAEQGAAANP